METNDVLVWMVVIANATLAFQAVRMQGMRSWLVPALSVLALTGVGWVIRPGVAGYVGLAAWGVFFWVPLLGMRLVVWQGMARRYGAAALTMGIVKWFRPVPESFAMARVLRAASWADGGEIERAEGELVELSRVEGNARMMAKMQLHRIRGDWEVLVQEMMAGGGINIGMMAVYVRALGETGRVNEMVRMMMGNWSGLMRPQYAMARAQAMMVYFAFLGRVE
ncbi:MAG TPA: hypothetical protein VFE58_19820, partial [Tepidisphaeraceae bacterium]|nr:hypothetical protein [Tepidisphaeraceae bacterium]